MLKTAPQAETTGGCGRGRGTTRPALAARVRLGSIRAHRVRIGRGGDGSPRAPPPPPPSPPGGRGRLQNLPGRAPTGLPGGGLPGPPTPPPRTPPEAPAPPPRPPR